MSGSVSDRKHLFKVAAGNLRNNHLYINGHYDFFPPDCIGSPRRKSGTGKPVEILLDGLGETLKTDITTAARNGKPRGFFRGRDWVRRFFEHHEVKTGDVLPMGFKGGRLQRYNDRVQA